MEKLPQSAPDQLNTGDGLATDAIVTGSVTIENTIQLWSLNLKWTPTAMSEMSILSLHKTRSRILASLVGSSTSCVKPKSVEKLKNS